MTIGLGLLGITGKTAFSFVGQRGLRYFEDHPFLELRALIADDPADVGKTFAEAVSGRWLLDEPVPDRWKDLVMVGIDGPALESAGVQLVLSALPDRMPSSSIPRSPRSACRSSASQPGSGWRRISRWSCPISTPITSASCRSRRRPVAGIGATSWPARCAPRSSWPWP